MGTPDYDLFRRNLPPEIIAYIPSGWAHGLGIVPIELGPRDFIVATADEHLDVGLLKSLMNRPDVELVRVTRAAMEYALARYYPV